MRKSLVVACLAMALCCGCSQRSNDSQETAPFVITDLQSLPVGLEVVHSPNPVLARTDGKSGYKYTWTFNTSVRSTGGPVTIHAFGSMVEQDGHWVLNTFTRELFTQKDFVEWYSCPGAVVSPATAFSDPSNWGGNNCLQPSRTKWFYVGVDDKGNRVMGEAIVEQVPELAD